MQSNWRVYFRLACINDRPYYSVPSSLPPSSPTSLHLSLSPALEHGNNRVKAAALKKVIQLVLSGERLPGLLMTIIRFVLPCNDHQIKKLLLIFWEIWPKTSPDGKLLHEMILVCDAYRKASHVAVWEEGGVCCMCEEVGRLSYIPPSL